MKRNRKFIAGLVPFLLVLALLPVGPAKAENMTELEERIAAEEKAKREAEEKAAALKASAEALSGELEKANSELDGILEQMIELDRSAQEVSDELEGCEAREAELSETLEQQKAMMELRIQYMYEQQSASFWEVLAGAESLSEMLSGAEYMSALSEYDRAQLSACRESLEQAKAVKAEAEAKQGDLQTLREEMQAQKEEYLAKTTQLLSEIEQFEAEIAAAGAEAEEYASRALADKTALSEMQAAAEEAARKAEEARKQAEEEARRKAEEEARRKAEEEARRKAEEEAGDPGQTPTAPASDVRGSGSVAIDPDGMNPSGHTNAELLAALLECECGSQTWEGQVAVGNVVLNRILDSRFQTNLYDVIFAAGQFTPAYTGTVDLVLARGVRDDCMKIARDVFGGARVLDTNYLYFCSAPAWESYPRSCTEYTFVCAHYFYY